jgi:hypothetical protein
MTKYAVMPILDPREQPHVKLTIEPNYNINNVFNPGTSAPFSGYSTNINVESELRNQIYALQKCSQSAYIPKSNSDLYVLQFNSSSKEQQPFPNLFVQEKYNDFNPNPYHIGNDLFNNSTRTQTKNLTGNKFC